MNGKELRKSATIGQQPRLQLTDGKAKNHMGRRILQQVLAQTRGAIGVAIQIPQHQPWPTASGFVVPMQRSIQLVFALFPVNCQDVDL